MSGLFANVVVAGAKGRESGLARARAEALTACFAGDGIVEALPRFFDRVAIGNRPLPEARDRQQQRLAQRRQFVVDARRDRRKHCARDQAVALQPAQGQ